jgi:hypothetical protein
MISSGLNMCIGSEVLGLKRKSIFQFSRKCENHAKIRRFLQNVCKISVRENFRFRENFRENLTKIFAKTKNPLNLTVIHGTCGVIFWP